MLIREASPSFGTTSAESGGARRECTRHVQYEPGQAMQVDWNPAMEPLAPRPGSMPAEKGDGCAKRLLFPESRSSHRRSIRDSVRMTSRQPPSGTSTEHTGRAIEETTLHPHQTTGLPSPPQETVEWTRTIPGTNQVDTPQDVLISSLCGTTTQYLNIPVVGVMWANDLCHRPFCPPISGYHALYCVNKKLCHCESYA